MAKYTGVTQNADSSWSYRIKKKVNGQVVDTKIKKDENGLPFLTARDAYEARKAHEDRLLSSAEKNESEPIKCTISDIYANYQQTEALKKAVSTLRKQESMWQNYIKPQFGDRDINGITIVELDSFLFELYKTHSYAYVEGFLKFFYLMFGHADRMEVIDPSRYHRMFVSRGTRLSMPEMSQSDYEDEQEGVTVYTDEELSLIEKAFNTEDGNLLLAFHLGLYCGLRISECFALRWRNIDFDRNVISIDRQLQYVDGCWHLSPVKTLKGVRQIYITEEFKEELWFYFCSQKHYQEDLGKGYRNFERIFDDLEKRWLDEDDRDFINRKKNGELLTTNSMKYWVKKINPLLKAYAENQSQVRRLAFHGISSSVDYKEFKYHNLRHTFATRCASANMNFHVLMQMMGHKKIETTRKYYINIDNDFVEEQTRKLLDNLYRK